MGTGSYPVLLKSLSPAALTPPIPLGCPWVGMNPKLGLLVGSIADPRVGGERFVCRQKVTCCKLAPELGAVQKERI